MTRTAWLSSLAAAWAAVVCLSGPASAQGGLAPADRAYVALGDSLGFGYTDFDAAFANLLLENDAALGDQGYAGLFADWLSTASGRAVQLVNLAAPGEEAATFAGEPQPPALLNGNYAVAASAGALPNQATLLDRTLSNFAATGTDVTHVSIHLGANDFFSATNRPGFYDLTPPEQDLLLGGALDRTVGTIREIAGTIEAAAPDATLLIMGLYDPYPGRPEHPRAPIADRFVEVANAALESLAGEVGGLFIELFDAFDGRETELTLIETDDVVSIPGFTQSLANVHPTAEGYRVTFEQMVAAIPGPGAAVIAFVALAAWRGRRR